ncbi:hypothetical protein RIF29_07130 [Crotalaria pallida]|uniref:Uncharacterized protein n=1 Tax=Crotalaria pallida TaxID=3830 RepID=A0AAN9J3W3_CROPI
MFLDFSTKETGKKCILISELFPNQFLISLSCLFFKSKHFRPHTNYVKLLNFDSWRLNLEERNQRISLYMDM